MTLMVNGEMMSHRKPCLLPKLRICLVADGLAKVDQQSPANSKHLSFARVACAVVNTAFVIKRIRWDPIDCNLGGKHKFSGFFNVI